MFIRTVSHFAVHSFFRTCYLFKKKEKRKKKKKRKKQKKKIKSRNKCVVKIFCNFGLRGNYDLFKKRTKLFTL